MTAPLTNETRGMFGAREFALMKDTAIFVNVARGGVVKEAELVEALKAGRPWAAGLDVFEVEPTPKDNPLFTLPNFVGTPHVGSATLKTRTAMATLAAQNLVAVLMGQPPLTPHQPRGLETEFLTRFTGLNRIMQFFCILSNLVNPV